MNGKKTKILCAVIAVLVVIIGILLGVLIAQNNKKTAEPGDDYAVSVENTTQDQNEATTTEEVSSKEETETEFLYYAKITESATWESGSDHCATENIIIYNKASNPVTSWKIDIIYASNPTVDDIWNGESEVNGNTITVTPADYNTEIPAGGSIDFGFNISAADLTVVDYKLYINGTEYTGSAISPESTEASEAVTEEVESKDPPVAESGTPFDNHGALSVSGTAIVDAEGKPYQLKGCSTHGMTWFPDYVNEDAFRTFRDDWGANLIRLAMYTDTGDSYGYSSGGNKDEIKALVDQGVQAATNLGMYVIVDWHILSDNNPNTHIEDAKAFFDEVTKKYANYENVLYEICNEPNGGTSWSEVKSYAETIIPIIRANDKDAIIIVGTPNWSQDVDIASKDPITGYDNIVYAVHFYAATHKEDLRNKVSTALNNGLPIFVSEFSICDASGNGGIDYGQADAWFELINEQNLSYAAWNISNKAETSSLIISSCSKTSGWTDDELSETGKYVKGKIQGK